MSYSMMEDGFLGFGRMSVDMLRVMVLVEVVLGWLVGVKVDMLVVCILVASEPGCSV